MHFYLFGVQARMFTAHGHHRPTAAGEPKAKTTPAASPLAPSASASAALPTLPAVLPDRPVPHQK